MNFKEIAIEIVLNEISYKKGNNKMCNKQVVQNLWNDISITQ